MFFTSLFRPIICSVLTQGYIIVRSLEIRQMVNMCQDRCENLTVNYIKVKDIYHNKRCTQGKAEQEPTISSVAPFGL